MENYGFLRSSYSIPQEVDLDQVLYTGAGMDFEPLTFEESAALQAASGQPFMTDVIHLTSQQIEEFLQRKLGISLGEVRKFNWTYLEQFDSYYVEHGDTNRVTFTCTGGWTEDGMYYLDCQSSDGAMHTALTLEKAVTPICSALIFCNNISAAKKSCRTDSHGICFLTLRTAAFCLSGRLIT